MAKNRNEIPEKLTWDLTTIYKTDKEWEAELTRIKSELSLVEEQTLVIYLIQLKVF
ncbi:Oligoendopeptidase F, plasmid [Lactococcus lactis]|nr:Oligoendopeptidase F, plasmid [Lactococcus lactis]